jgi:hypothetical protein
MDSELILVGLSKAWADNLSVNFKNAGLRPSNAEFVGWHIISVLIAPWPPLKEAL